MGVHQDKKVVQSKREQSTKVKGSLWNLGNKLRNSLGLH